MNYPPPKVSGFYILSYKTSVKNYYFYYAEDASNDYCKTLVESRQGIDFENDKFRKIDEVQVFPHHFVSSILIAPKTSKYLSTMLSINLCLYIF